MVEEPAEDIASPEEVPAADENGETSLIEVLGDDTNLRVSPSIEGKGSGNCKRRNTVHTSGYRNSRTEQPGTRFLGKEPRLT